MQFILFGLVVAVAVGAVAWGVIFLLTRRRVRAPFRPGRWESALVVTAAIAGGPLIIGLLVLKGGGRTGPHFAEEMMMLGAALAMPASAMACWMTGELVSGPTRRNWRPLAAVFVAAELGFVLASLLAAVAGYALWKVQAAEPWPSVLIVTEIVAAYVGGGAACAWAYLRLRGEPLLARSDAG